MIQLLVYNSLCASLIGGMACLVYHAAIRTSTYLSLPKEQATCKILVFFAPSAVIDESETFMKGQVEEN